MLLVRWLRRAVWLATDVARYFATLATRAELDAYRLSRLPPSPLRLFRIVWDGVLCLLLTGSAPLRLERLVDCAIQHLLVKTLYDRRSTTIKLTAFSVNYLIYDLSPGQVLRMESLFAYNPFVDKLQFPQSYEEVLSRLSKGCCFGMSISYILHHLHGSRAFIDSAAYGVPALAQQIQLFCESQLVWTKSSTDLMTLTTKKMNQYLEKLCLRAGWIRGPQKVSIFTGIAAVEGTYLILWTKDDLRAAGHASVLVIEKDEVMLYEPNLGELRGPRKSLNSILRIVQNADSVFESFSLCPV